MGVEVGGTSGEREIVCDGCHNRMAEGARIYKFNRRNYCSKGCLSRAKLEHEKPLAQQALKKWELKIEKMQKQIRNLKVALEGSDPDAIWTARHGGGYTIFKRTVKIIFILPSIVFWIAALVAGVVFIYNKSNEKPANKTCPESPNATHQMGVTNDISHSIML